MRFVLAASPWLACATLMACGAPVSPQSSSPGSAASANDTPGPVDQATSAGNANGTAPSPGNGVGAVQGYALVPHSAASAVLVGDYDGLVLVVSNQNDYCGALSRGETHAHHIALVASLVTTTADGNTVKVSPGTYPIVGDVPQTAGNAALAVFRASDASCGDLLADPDDVATGGSVEVTALDAKQASGAFTLSSASGTVQGSFVAPLCPALAAQGQSGAPLTCVP